MFNAPAQYYKINIKPLMSYRQEIVAGYFLLAHPVDL